MMGYAQLSMTKATLLSFVLQACALATTVKLDFNLEWLLRNPDGLAERPVIGVNGQWPLPQINATVGDRIRLKVHNSLGNQSASIHFHGLFMNGTSHMDGTSYVSQCAIAPGTSFTYDFTVNQPGTYWYHSHTLSQYPDGLRGLLIVKDPAHPFQGQYDDELVVSLSDWYHEQMPDLLKKYDDVVGMQTDPSPQTNLINDQVGAKLSVEAGKTYLVHVANIGAFLGQYFWIEDHTMIIVEVDGVYTEKASAEMLYLGAGQRYSFLLTIDEPNNIPIVSRLDTSSLQMKAGRPVKSDAVAWLAVDAQHTFPEAREVLKLDYFDDLQLVPIDKQPLMVVDRSITIDIDMHRQADQVTHWMFNSINYEPPQLPSLFSALSAGTNATDIQQYPPRSQTFVLNHNEVVEIVMKNKHMRRHPIHLHGHNFQVTHRSGGTFNDTPTSQAPMRRDTIVANSHGTLRFRFRADNPGVWLFHCHMEWHAHSGLMATFVEAPLELQKQRTISQAGFDPDPDRVCTSQQMSSPESSDDEVAKSSSLLRTVGMIASLTIIGAVIFFLGYMLIAPRFKSSSYELVPIAEDDRNDIDLDDKEDTQI